KYFGTTLEHLRSLIFRPLVSSISLTIVANLSIYTLTGSILQDYLFIFCAKCQYRVSSVNFGCI
ncbi:hypothetical protein BIW11_06899, partial [Tropilaelaps mercedesae]